MTVHNNTAIEILCDVLLTDTSSLIRCYAAQALGEVAQDSEEAIAALGIAARQDQETIVRTMAVLAIATLCRSNQSQQTMPDKNVSKVQMIFNAQVKGDVVGNVEGDMIVNPPSPDQAQAITDVLKVLQDLYEQHPSASAPEVSDFIETELQQIKKDQPQRWQIIWQSLLNPKRWQSSGKAALVKAGEHFTEENLWGKVAIAFLEQFSENADPQ